jgi:hypothetical protein
MSGEVTSTPQTDEELAAAAISRAAAEKAEAEAHEAARQAATPESIAARAELGKVQIGNAFNAQFIAMWDLAMVTGNTAHYVNAALFNVAVILANTKTHAEEVRIFEYLQKTASGLKEKAQQQPPLGAK